MTFYLDTSVLWVVHHGAGQHVEVYTGSVYVYTMYTMTLYLDASVLWVVHHGAGQHVEVYTGSVYVYTMYTMTLYLDASVLWVVHHGARQRVERNEVGQDTMYLCTQCTCVHNVHYDLLP
jgi:hypothetical protein